MPFQSHLRDFSTAKAFSSAHHCDLECVECVKRQPYLVTAIHRMERVSPLVPACFRTQSTQAFGDINPGAERESLSDGRL